jgi:circadian clock protein KaiC
MNRVKTGIEGLDHMLGGGFLSETANLVEGAPGTGKTTLGMQFIHHGITQQNEPGLILTFEEFPNQYYRDAAMFGWDFRGLEQAGKLRVIMTSPEVSRADWANVDGRIQAMSAEIGAQRILVDSISHFERLTTDPVELRGILYGFINALKRHGLTSVLTRESSALIGEADATEEDIAFVADSYILLRYVEIESAINKALLVLKLRGSDHAKDIRQFEITPRGIEVRARFEGREGIMSGSPHRMADSFKAAFVKKRRSHE